MPPVPRSRFDALGDPQSHHGRGASPVTVIRPRNAAMLPLLPAFDLLEPLDQISGVDTQHYS